MRTVLPFLKAQYREILVLTVCAIALCYTCSFGKSDTAAGVSTDNNEAVHLVLDSDEAERRPATNQGSPPETLATQLLPIEKVQVGMRVPAYNPEVDDREREQFAEPSPETWRLLELEHKKAAGGILRIHMLRPIRWIHEQDLHVGSAFQIDLPELGAQGSAMVVDMQPCPEIPSGPGHVVLSTFAHPASHEILDLTIGDDQDTETIGVTETHPFWSIESDAFIPAGQLVPGSQVLTRQGQAKTVISVLPRPGPPQQVYNLEVNGEHVYYVGQQELLVHNQYPIKEFDVRPLGQFSTPITKGDGLTGHELLQSAWLRIHKSADRTSALGRRNPAIALTESQHHKYITALQSEAGLHSRSIISRQSARENIMENVQLLKEAGVPREAILQLLIATRRFLLENGL